MLYTSNKLQFSVIFSLLINNGRKPPIIFFPNLLALKHSMFNEFSKFSFALNIRPRIRLMSRIKRASAEHFQVVVFLCAAVTKAALASWLLLAAWLMSKEKATVRISIRNSGLSAMVKA